MSYFTLYYILFLERLRPQLYLNFRALTKMSNAWELFMS